MSKKIRLAISTCPNDTFSFHAILNNEIDLRGIQFSIEMLDIAELNRGLLADKYDVVKASFHAAIKAASSYYVLPSGSALGFGNGPLLLSARPNICPSSNSETTLCPGENTTATLLFKMFYGNTIVRHVVFSDIMPALQMQQADFGVCIHEGRFTYKESNLFLVEDLGERWESETSSPLPLGGILAKKSLETSTIDDVQAVIRESILFGMANRDKTKDTMQRFARELSEDVLFDHVDLYVNHWTVDLGADGRSAICKLSDLAKPLMGLESAGNLEVFESRPS